LERYQNAYLKAIEKLRLFRDRINSSFICVPSEQNFVYLKRFFAQSCTIEPDRLFFDPEKLGYIVFNFSSLLKTFELLLVVFPWILKSLGILLIVFSSILKGYEYTVLSIYALLHCKGQ